MSSSSDIVVQQHFVRFYSPGTFFAEITEQPIETWDVGRAMEMARSVVERYNATPYGFRFVTRGRSGSDLDSRELAQGHMYYLGGIIRTLEEVLADNHSGEEILRQNMASNRYQRVVTNDNSWKWTQPMAPEDVVLDWQGAAQKEQAG